MPTLKMRPYEVTALREKEKGLELKLMLKEFEDEKFKIGEQIYYGYPLEHSGRIEGILTKGNFLYTKEIVLDKYDFIYRNADQRYV
jgi:hypothetical protein